MSLDDDSYPVDADFFQVVMSILQTHPQIAVLEAQIWQRNDVEIARSAQLSKTLGFTGCGHAVRVAAYRALPGYLPVPVCKRFEYPTPGSRLTGYRGLKRVGIQYWRIATTAAGISL